MKPRCLLAVSALLLLSACAGQPGFWFVNTPDDAGELPGDYKEQTAAMLKKNFGEPYDIQIGDAHKASCTQVVAHRYGWAVPVSFRTRNAFEGDNKGIVWWANGKISKVTRTAVLCH